MPSRVVSFLLLCLSFVIIFATPAMAVTQVTEVETRDKNVQVNVKSEVSREGTTLKNTTRVKQEAETRVKDDVRCAAVNARANARINFYNDRKDNHLEQYRSIQERIKNLITQLKTRGYDTTKLEQDLTELDRLIVVAATDYSAFITKLEATKNFECGNKSGEFLIALKSAQAALETFRKDVIAIRTFIQTTLKADLEALKVQRTNREEAL